MNEWKSIKYIGLIQRLDCVIQEHQPLQSNTIAARLFVWCESTVESNLKRKNAGWHVTSGLFGVIVIEWHYNITRDIIPAKEWCETCFVFCTYTKHNEYYYTAIIMSHYLTLYKMWKFRCLSLSTWIRLVVNQSCFNGWLVLYIIFS